MSRVAHCLLNKIRELGDESKLMNGPYEVQLGLEERKIMEHAINKLTNHYKSLSDKELGSFDRQSEVDRLCYYHYSAYEPAAQSSS